MAHEQPDYQRVYDEFLIVAVERQSKAEMEFVRVEEVFAERWPDIPPTVVGQVARHLHRLGLGLAHEEPGETYFMPNGHALMKVSALRAARRKTPLLERMTSDQAARIWKGIHGLTTLILAILTVLLAFGIIEPLA